MTSLAFYESYNADHCGLVVGENINIRSGMVLWEVRPYEFEDNKPEVEVTVHIRKIYSVSEVNSLPTHVIGNDILYQIEGDLIRCKKKLDGREVTVRVPVKFWI